MSHRPALSAPENRQTSVKLVVLAALFFLASVAGVELNDPDTQVAVAWPASGVGIAAFLLTPRSMWPRTAALLTIAGAGSLAAFSAAPAPVVGLTALNLGQALVGALAFQAAARRLDGASTALQELGGLAAAVAAVVPFSFAGGALLHALLGAPLLGAAKAWLLADALGVLVALPVCLLLRPRSASPGSGLAARLLGVGLLVAQLLVLIAVFWEPADTGGVVLRYPFAAVPLLLLLAILGRPRLMAISLLATTLVAAAATVRELGPFMHVGIAEENRMLLLQTFLATVTILVHLIDAVTTERSSVTRLLAHSDQRSAGLLRAAGGVAVIATDARGVITDFSAGASRLLGFAPEHVVGNLRLVELCDQDELRARADARELSATALLEATADSRTRDWTWRRIDGRPVHVSLTLSTLHDEAGAVAGFVGIAQDMTARRAAETELRRSEEHRRAIMASLPDVSIVLCDSAQRVVLADGDALASWGVDPLTAPGQRLAAVSPSASARFSTLLDLAIAGTPADDLAQVDGRSYHVMSVPLAAEDGAACAFLMLRDVTAERRHAEQLRFVAEHDSLTGLLNRRRFEEHLAHHVALVRRHGPDGALMMVDIDGFKQVNDTLGHAVGDQLIIAVARHLEQRLRTTDVLARLGGDEFAILLPKVDRAGAELVATQIVDLLAEIPIQLDGLPTGQRVAASVGVTMIGVDRTQDITAGGVLADADLAMYDAKADGGGRWSPFADETRAEPKTKSNLVWLERIRSALSTDGFTLLAQPIVDVGSGDVHGYELLIRMVDDEGGLIPPGLFLPVAEHFGLMPQLDRWVVGRAIELLADPAARTDATIAVNVSGQTICDDVLVDLIAERIGTTGADPTRLVVEITETAAISDLGAAQRFAERLGALGVGVSLDDFGAGFGSFTYFKHLPASTVKIDGEFVRACADNPIDQLVISSLVQLARTVGKRTVAEFVEDAATMDLLRRLDVDSAQGYHLGRPQPLEDTLLTRVPSRRAA